MGKSDTLRALVRPSSNVAFLREGGAELVTGAFDDDAAMQRLVAGVDVVIHNGYWHDRNELQDPMAWFELNVLGSLKLLEFARRAGRKRFIFISTGAVYGKVNEPDRPRDERTGCFPQGGYAAYNRAVEVYVPAYRSEFGMTGSTSVRLCGGPNVGVHPKIEKSPYVDIVRAALKGEAIHVKGAHQVDWNVDIARNLRLIATLPLTKVEEVYCSCDGVFPVREIARTIVRALGSRSEVIEDEDVPPGVTTSNTLIRRAGASYSGLSGIESYARELARALEAAGSAM
jgi:nucleoside-diphosphate-sugar epimerase